MMKRSFSHRSRVLVGRQCIVHAPHSLTHAVAPGAEHGYRWRAASGDATASKEGNTLHDADDL
jgi:hypothetical protein